MGRTLAQYDDRIRNRLGDLGVAQHFRGEATTLALEAALGTFSNDHPREITQTIAGDSATYNLDLDDGAAAGQEFISGWSRITAVEYPAGERQPEYLEETYDWLEVHDAGTNYLRLINTTPATGENVKVTYTAPWPYPTDTATDDPLPTVYADAVAALAASQMAYAKGTKLAAQQSTSVVGQINANNPEALFTAAAGLRKAYETTVLGRPASAGAAPQIGYAVTEVDVFPDAIFHGRSRSHNG